MDEHIDQDYENECPKCGHSPIHSKTCDSLSCNDGLTDEHDDDPINFAPGESLLPCDECQGRGIVVWCPKCGMDLTQHNFPDADPDEL